MLPFCSFEFDIFHISLSPIFLVATLSLKLAASFAVKITPCTKLENFFPPQETGNQKNPRPAMPRWHTLRHRRDCAWQPSRCPPFLVDVLHPSRAVKNHRFFHNRGKGLVCYYHLFFWKNFTQILVIGVFVKKNWGSLRN